MRVEEEIVSEGERHRALTREEAVFDVRRMFANAERTPHVGMYPL
jgi:hypothetical protein